MEILLVTLFVGLFFLFGALISLIIKNKSKLISFSLGISFSLMILLIIIDVIPEAISFFERQKMFGLLAGVLIGFGVLLLLDKIVPHHHGHSQDEKHNHLEHIGIITAIALIIHNIVEGAGIAVVLEANLKSGIIYAFGAALHNLPFGIKIATMFHDKKKMFIYITLLTSSTLVGAILLLRFNFLLTDFILGTLLSITVGMILYIILFELLPELKENFNKYSGFGIVTGILMMILAMVI